MALGKRVKQGGSYFKGYQLTVNSAAADYVLHVDTAHQVVINSLQLIPDSYGIGDYITVGHYVNSTAGSGLVDTIADTIYNAGGGAGIDLEFPALEPMLADEDLRITYTNVASVAMVLNIIVEFAR